MIAVDDAARTTNFDGGAESASDDLPTTPNPPVTVVRNSATSTIVGAAHVHNARASKGRGERVYRVTDADFGGGTISGLADSNLTVLSYGDYVEFYDETGATPYLPQFVTKIDTWNDTIDQITLTGENFFGSLPPNSQDRWTIVVWRPSRERPLFSFINTYGLHRINNLRLGYGRMVRAQGGTEKFPVRTVFDGVLFCGRARDPLNVELGATWLYGGPYEFTLDPDSATARTPSVTSRVS